MTEKKYRMTKDSQIKKEVLAGTIVYRCKGYDYGCASDDTRMTGIEHKSFTLSETGDYPFFTVPLTDVEEVL